MVSTPIAVRVVAALVVGVAATSFVAVGTPQPPAVASTPQDTRAQLLRQQFGLDASMSHVLAVKADVSSDTSELAIPLTQSETAELKRRDAQLPDIQAMEKSASAMPGFAGLWIDQAHGGRVVALFTPSTAASAIKAFGDMAPAGLAVAVNKATYTLAQLTNTQQATLDAALANPKATALLQDSAVDIEGNRTVFHVTDTDALRALLPTSVLNSPGLVIENVATKWTAQSRNITSGPAYGGEWTNGTSKCTIGYSGALSSAGNPYTMTAGHCDVVNGSTRYQGYSSTASANSLGTVKNNTTLSHASYNCDCEAVGPIPSAKATTSVLVAGNGTFSYGQTASGYSLGERACLSGAAYGDAFNNGIACGQITATSGSETYSVQGAPFTLTDSIQTNITYSSGGDSGGPYGNGSQFLGIHAAGNCSFDKNGNPIGDCTQTAFSKSTHITSAIGLTLRY